MVKAGCFVINCNKLARLVLAYMCISIQVTIYISVIYAIRLYDIYAACSSIITPIPDDRKTGTLCMSGL